VFGISLCKFWLTCDVLCCTASILNLCAIAVDRYQAIHDPINYRAKRTLSRVLFTIVLVWLLSALTSVPPLLGWNDWPDVFDESVPCKLTEQPGYVVLSASVSFYIPLVIMTTVYVKIFVATKQRYVDLRLPFLLKSKKTKIQFKLIYIFSAPFSPSSLRRIVPYFHLHLIIFVLIRTNRFGHVPRTVDSIAPPSPQPDRHQIKTSSSQQRPNLRAQSVKTSTSGRTIFGASDRDGQSNSCERLGHRSCRHFEHVQNRLSDDVRSSFGGEPRLDDATRTEAHFSLSVPGVGLFRTKAQSTYVAQ
jgi:hypothetical protein